MSNVTASDDGTQDSPGLSLTEAVEDVSKRGCSQTEALKEKERTLCSLQDTLSDVELRVEAAEQELRSTEREVLVLEGDMEHLERQTKVLHDRCVAITKDNTELQHITCEEEEKARTARAGFDTYRNKMKAHRAAVMHVVSQTGAHKELEEKRTLVRTLRQKKEELKKDLENPNGDTVRMAKRDIDALKEKISMTRKDIAERRARLQKEYETHTQIKRDIEIHHKRFEAVVKRLHCQLSRARGVSRQMSENIYQMERQLDDLKKQLGSSQDPTASGH